MLTQTPMPRSAPHALDIPFGILLQDTVSPLYLELSKLAIQARFKVDFLIVRCIRHVERRHKWVDL